MSWLDYVLLALVGIWFVLAVRRMLRTRRHGCCGCSGHCGQCGKCQ